MAKKKNIIKDGVKLDGFFRLNVLEDGKVVSDSGWVHNQKTNLGMQSWLCYCLLASAGSALPTYAAVGSGTAPASNATSLPGESALGGTLRAALAGSSSVNGSTQLQWLASWNSSAGGTLWTIGNAGLFAHSSAASCLCGVSTTGQTWNTNQTLALTYQLNLS